MGPKRARIQALLEELARREAEEGGVDAAAVAAVTVVVVVRAGGGDGRLSRPLEARITSPFGMRFHPILHVWKLHDGTDFAVPCGTPVFAAADGTVVARDYGGGNGNALVIDHGRMRWRDHRAATYNHLTSFVVKGGRVTRGQLIAYSGTTGYSTGCHLHFETWRTGIVDPMKWLCGREACASGRSRRGQPAGPEGPRRPPGASKPEFGRAGRAERWPRNAVDR